MTALKTERRLDSWVGIETVQRVEWSVVRIPVRARDFTPLQNVHTDSAAHLASEWKGSGVLSRCKGKRCDTDLSLSSSA